MLQKIESLFEELSYKIRYEKGNFQSGYCVVADQHIIVVNKFFDTEARIICLLEVLDSVDVQEEELTDGALKTYSKIRKTVSESPANAQ
jgi:hypothetical protein